MATTAWGSPITFGWEFESTNMAILDWFAIEDHEGIDAAAWSGATAAEREDWQQEFISWEGLARRDNCPQYIDELKSENHDDLYELVSEPTASIAALREQLVEVHSQLARPGDRTGFHVHVVFQLPKLPTLDDLEQRPYVARRHARIAALFHVLNDYAWSKTALAGPAMHYHQHTGPATRKPQRLTARLQGIAPDEEGQGPTGDSVGIGAAAQEKYKFGGAGLRGDFYNPDDFSWVGFELRRGFHDTVEQLVSAAQVIVQALESDLHEVNLQDSVLGTQDPVLRGLNSGLGLPAARYSLDDYYTFATGAGQVPQLDNGLLEQLKAEARVVAQLGERVPQVSVVRNHYKNVAGGESKEILRRWLMAFKPWERHPAIVADSMSVSHIRLGRMALVNELSAWLSGPEARRGAERFPRAPGGRPSGGFSDEGLDYVSLQVHKFVESLVLHLSF